MTTSLRLCLKTGQKIYINGAVLRSDRKVTLELLNHADFLLAQHFVSADETTTPLRQLYFMVQTLLIDPRSAASIRPMIDTTIASLRSVFENRLVRQGIERVAERVAHGNNFEALKILRSLFPVEADIIAHGRSCAEPVEAQAARISTERQEAPCS